MPAHLGQGLGLWATDNNKHWDFPGTWFLLNARLWQVSCSHTHTHTNFRVCSEHTNFFFFLNAGGGCLVCYWMWDFPPGEHDVGVGVACAGACGAPFDSVDLFTVSLEVVDAGLLLHTPDLQVKEAATAKYDRVQITTQVCLSLTSKTWGLKFYL